MFRLRPEPDELLTSFLTRAAHRRGLPLWTFLNQAIGRNSLIASDCDVAVSPAMACRLAKTVSVDPHDIHGTTLEREVSLLLCGRAWTGQAPFLLPAGVFAGLRTRWGLQACPRCLGEKPAYFRKAWRFAFYTVCQQHHVPMIDRCPECGQPIAPHRAPHGGLDRCWNCHLSLAVTSASGSQLAIPAPLSEELHRVVASRPTRDDLMPGVSEPDVAILAIRVRALITAMVPSGRLRALLNASGEVAMASAHKKMQLELLSVEARHAIFKRLSPAFTDWPESFYSFMTEQNLLPSSIPDDSFGVATAGFFPIVEQVRRHRVTSPLVHDRPMKQARRRSRCAYRHLRARKLISTCNSGG